MAKIIRLLSDGNRHDGYNDYNISLSLSCGDGYKDGLYHRFIGNELDVKNLIEIIKRLKITNITNITPTSFDWNSKNKGCQQFVFRLCRFVRFKGFLDLILDINKKHKVTIHNAILLAGYELYYDNKLSYFNSGRDILFLNANCFLWSFPTLKDFRNHLENINSNFYLIYRADCHTANYKFKTEKVRTRFNTTESVVNCRNEFNNFKLLIAKKEYKKIERIVKKRLY